MVEFIKKMMDWALKKEQEAAKKCYVPVETVDKQIAEVEAKKKELEERCQSQIEELGHILDKLHWIKAESMKCNIEEDKDSK